METKLLVCKSINAEARILETSCKDYTHYFFVKFFLASSTLRGVKNKISSFEFLKLECKILMFSEEVNHICHTTVHPYKGA